MSGVCNKPPIHFGFSPQRIAEAIRRKGLLSMEIEFSLACNFNCVYCYNQQAHSRQALSNEQIDDTVKQAKQLGAEKIVVLGGEPMIYPSIHNRIRFIRRQGLEIQMFTNGSHMSMENAQFMYDHRVAVVLKMNSLQKALQNEMAGRDDAYDIIHDALKNLREAGYPSNGRLLAVSTVICRQNIEELPAMWRWLRNESIEPYFEMITPQGGAESCKGIYNVSLERQQELFKEISRIDREEFGCSWEPQPPLVGNRCLRHCFSCLVNSSGEVMPCVGITIPLGNVKHQSLKSILDESEVMDNLRKYQETIKGPWPASENSEFCYGCRGAAYQLTGDYLASDPLCWHNTGKKREIETLPAPVSPFLPHSKPMLLIDTVESVGERSGHIKAKVEADTPFIKRDGSLSETAFIEMLAQSLAALEGFNMKPALRSGHKGVLLGVKNFKVHRPCRVGDTLDIHVKKIGKFGDFGAASGTVSSGDKKIAGGELTFFRSGGTDK